MTVTKLRTRQTDTNQDTIEDKKIQAIKFPTQCIKSLFPSWTWMCFQNMMEVKSWRHLPTQAPQPFIQPEYTSVQPTPSIPSTPDPCSKHLSHIKKGTTLKSRQKRTINNEYEIVRKMLLELSVSRVSRIFCVQLFLSIIRLSLTSPHTHSGSKVMIHAWEKRTLHLSRNT